MTGFWILGAIGVLILAHGWAWDYAANRAFKRGYDEGREHGRLEAEVYWMEQGRQVLKAQGEIWREKQ
jgi:hypothetical protein